MCVHLLFAASAPSTWHKYATRDWANYVFKHPDDYEIYWKQHRKARNVDYLPYPEPKDEHIPLWRKHLPNWKQPAPRTNKSVARSAQLRGLKVKFSSQFIDSVASQKKQQVSKARK